MPRIYLIPCAPVLLGLLFILWVAMTRNSWAQDTSTTQIVVMVELLLLLIGMVAVLCQLPLFIYALVKSRLKLAGVTALGIVLWITFFLVGMGLGPAMVWVT